ncbi:hypothetical protein V6N12_048993 [Hibiscus sabdariffa]|uniref:Uncharacterized protein n=1 Tax=Hibiscus sabdariffa TaxID=183260 RepID=A0ABR2EIW2_9ROSI
MLFFATLWSLWLNRNELLFHGKGLNVAQLSDIVLLRVDWWARAKWPHSPMSVEDFLRNPDYWCRSLSEKDARVKEVWLAPPVGAVKFNTNGAVKGVLGLPV